MYYSIFKVAFQLPIRKCVVPPSFMISIPFFEDKHLAILIRNSAKEMV